MPTEREVADDDKGPSWVGPIENFIDSAAEINDLLRVHRSSVHLAAVMPEIASAVFRASPKEKSGVDDAMNEIEELALAAQRLQEMERYPLNSHLLMGTWAAFEVMCHDLAVEWLIGHPQCLSGSDQKVRISLGQLIGLDQRGQAEMIIDQVEREFGSSFVPGADLPEKVLAVLGIGGRLDATTRRSLIEAHQVRNVLAHKGGRVDAHFVRVCEWLPVEQGDRLFVTDGQLELYTLFQYKYAWTLWDRCAVADGGAARGTADVDTLISDQCSRLADAETGWWNPPQFPQLSDAEPGTADERTTDEQPC